MNRRTLFKILAAIPFIRSIPVVKRWYTGAQARIYVAGVPFEHVWIDDPNATSPPVDRVAIAEWHARVIEGKR